MDIKEYISSGIIESYVLGLASEEERIEFEKMAAEYPEVEDARISFEIALEKQAIENAMQPPASVRQGIFEKLSAVMELESQVPVRKINASTSNWLKYAVAACLLLLVASIFWNINLYNSNKRLKNDYQNSNARLKAIENDMHVIQNPNIKMATMKGMPVSPASFATIYWDTTSHDVYLLVNNLPQPAGDKQYQLWAIINNKPVDLGVFDIKKEKLLIQAKNVQQAQAFAITLEQKGGSPEGPKGDMYVKGEL